jgi:hypothetical protein
MKSLDIHPLWAFVATIVATSDLLHFLLISFCYNKLELFLNEHMLHWMQQYRDAIHPR